MRIRTPTCDSLHRFVPRLRVTELQHARQKAAGFCTVIEVALVQSLRVAARVAHGFVELELRDVAEEVADVGRAVDHVRLRTGVEHPW